MKEIYIKNAILNNLSNTFKNSSNSLENLEADMKKALNSLDWNVENKNFIENKIKESLKNINKFKLYSNNISKFINEIIQLYQATDNKACSEIDLINNSYINTNTNPYTENGDCILLSRYRRDDYCLSFSCSQEEEIVMCPTYFGTIDIDRKNFDTYILKHDGDCGLATCTIAEAEGICGFDTSEVAYCPSVSCKAAVCGVLGCFSATGYVDLCGGAACGFAKCGGAACGGDACIGARCGGDACAGAACGFAACQAALCNVDACGAAACYLDKSGDCGADACFANFAEGKCGAFGCGVVGCEVAICKTDACAGDLCTAANCTHDACGGNASLLEACIRDACGGEACGGDACGAEACAGDACAAQACAAKACAANACAVDVSQVVDVGPCAINFIPGLPFI